MSQERPIWNDGQGLATPDLQRSCDDVGAVDDRVNEMYLTPGSVQKKVMPLLEETATVNPRLLAIPSSGALSPVGTNGAVRIMPALFKAGSPTDAQRIALAGTLYAPLDSVAIASNSSGLIRYDLIYVTLTRSVSTTGTRKIKSATDGTLSSQVVNLADAPSLSVGINSGFLTGATAPTQAQILAATPADTAPSSSTFGSFSFPIAYVTVANGYASGTTLFQDSSGGTTYITQCWNGDFVHGQRVRSLRPASVFYGSANEKYSNTVITKYTQRGERWGSMPQMFFLVKNLTSTPTTAASAVVIDNTIDWRNRFVWGICGYCNFSGNSTLESTALNISMAATTGVTGAASANALYNGPMPPVWVGAGNNAAGQSIYYTDSVVGNAHSLTFVFKTDGTLAMYRVGAPNDGTNGDVVMIVLSCTDQIKLNG